MLKKSPIKEINIDELIDNAINALTRNHAYYQTNANPLKSAIMQKTEHLEFLIKVLNLEHFKENLHGAIRLMAQYLPEMIGREGWNKILSEFSGARCRIQQLEETKTRTADIQKDLGVSDESLNCIYLLGRSFLLESKFDEASQIFVLLTYLKPQAHEYWLGEGISLYSTNQYEFALAYFDIAKILESDKAAPYVYSFSCYTNLNDIELANENLNQANLIISKSPDEEQKWGEIIKSMAKKE